MQIIRTDGVGVGQRVELYHVKSRRRRHDGDCRQTIATWLIFLQIFMVVTDSYYLRSPAMTKL